MQKNKITLSLILPLLAAGPAFAAEFEVLDKLVVASSITAGGEKFKVNASGDLIRINNVAYAWPASDGEAGTYLKDVLGNGTLSWAAGGAPLTPWTENIHGAGYNLTCASVTATGIGLGAAQLRLAPANNIVISSEASAALGAGVRVSTNIYIVGFSSAAKYYGDGSSLTGMTINDNTKVLKVGDTMTGALVLPADPTAALQAATKQYVDAVRTDVNTCPSDMAYIPGPEPFCVDKYEAYLLSGSKIGCSCTTGSQTEVDACNTTAVAGSATGQTPIVSITWCEAKRACMNAGKHLLTDVEWFRAANYKGSQYNITAEQTAETMQCNTAAGGINLTGAHALCVTQEGVYDMIGNAAEFVDRVLFSEPTNGLAQNYITGYDFATGFPTSVGASSNPFGNDSYYPYNGGGTARVVVRGGAYGDGNNCGVFYVSVWYGLSMGANLGFRCGKRR